MIQLLRFQWRASIGGARNLEQKQTCHLEKAGALVEKEVEHIQQTHSTLFFP